MNDTPLPTLRIAIAVFLTLATLSLKRKRDVDEWENDDCTALPHRARNDAERGWLRQTSVRRLLALDKNIFKKMFRMDREAFLLLHSKIYAKLNKHWTPRSVHMAQISSGSHVDTILLLASTIRWLAGGSPWDIAYAFHVSYSTLHAKKYEVIAAINAALWNNINFPTSQIGLQKLADGFARISGGKGGIIPNIVAAVDSVVIHRKAPVASKEKNIAAQFCRKGYFATTLLAFVDASGRFLSTSITCASSSHDSTLFACSKLGRKILSGGLGDKWSIVGDDAFTCGGNIITPFAKHTLNPKQRNYNYFCSLNRQAVECAFGRWKNKWGILWRPLLVDSANIKAVIQVTCRLHNFSIDQGTGSAENVAFEPPLEDLWWQVRLLPNYTCITPLTHASRGQQVPESLPLAGPPAHLSPSYSLCGRMLKQLQLQLDGRYAPALTDNVQ
jgi:hypothetical protein